MHRCGSATRLIGCFHGRTQCARHAMKVHSNKQVKSYLMCVCVVFIVGEGAKEYELRLCSAKMDIIKCLWSNAPVDINGCKKNKKAVIYLKARDE